MMHDGSNPARLAADGFVPADAGREGARPAVKTDERLVGESGADVMVVADDRSLFGIVKKVLAAETECRLGAFYSPHLALADLELTSPAVVIADARIRGTDTMSFLERVGEMAPAATRILVNGDGGRERTLRAIDGAEIQRRPERDHEFDRLVLMVRHGIERADLLNRVEVQGAMIEEITSELRRIRRRIGEIFL